MGFDEQIRTLINEAEVPERLEPENIALMLKEKTAQKKRKEIKQSSTGVKSKNTAIAIRSTATLAACIALTFGVVALVEDMNAPTVKPEITQENKASDYHDVYSVIQDTIINNPSEGSEEISAVQIPNTTDMTTITSEKNKDYVINAAADKIEKADIVKTDGTNLYYIANGTLYFVSAENGNRSASRSATATANCASATATDANGSTASSATSSATADATSPSPNCTDTARPSI